MKEMALGWGQEYSRLIEHDMKEMNLIKKDILSLLTLLRSRKDAMKIAVGADAVSQLCYCAVYVEQKLSFIALSRR